MADDQTYVIVTCVLCGRKRQVNLLYNAKRILYTDDKGCPNTECRSKK